MSRASKALGATALMVGLLGLAAPAHARGGQPTVEREMNVVTFLDDFILDICGVETMTTLTERITRRTYPDGTVIVHVNAEFVPENPGIPIERDAFKDVISPDGTLTTVGLAIHLINQGGGGTVIRDAGWVRFIEDGLVVRGPHPFLDIDPADVFCP